MGAINVCTYGLGVSKAGGAVAFDTSLECYRQSKCVKRVLGSSSASSSAGRLGIVTQIIFSLFLYVDIGHRDDKARSNDRSMHISMYSTLCASGLTVWKDLVSDQPPREVIGSH